MEYRRCQQRNEHCAQWAQWNQRAIDAFVEAMLDAHGGAQQFFVELHVSTLPGRCTPDARMLRPCAQRSLRVGVPCPALRRVEMTRQCCPPHRLMIG